MLQAEKQGRFRRDLVGAALKIGAEIGAGLRNLRAEMKKKMGDGLPVGQLSLGNKNWAAPGLSAP